MSMTSKPKAVLIGNKWSLQQVYPEALVQEISASVDWIRDPLVSGIDGDAGNFNHVIPPGTEYIFGTWGMPLLDKTVLDGLPQLKGVFYAAGSVKVFVTDALWERGIPVFSAARSNAVPVAEFTVAQIVLGLKNMYRMRVTEEIRWKSLDEMKGQLHGSFRSRVGLISYGIIARLVRRLLRSYDHEVWLYDPFIKSAEAEAEGVRLCSLEDIFRECQVVSLHTPLLKETVNMIRGHHLASMAPNGVFINTARGAIVHQQELGEVLGQRPDLTAVLDVLHPEPPLPDDPLLALPNAWITPHIAGSMGRECARMAADIHEAFKDHRAGKASIHEVTKADMDHIA